MKTAMFIRVGVKIIECFITNPRKLISCSILIYVHIKVKLLLALDCVFRHEVRGDVMGDINYPDEFD